MPIYEYACSDCGHRFETLVRTGTVPQCPDCHSQSLEKQLSVIAKPAESAAALPAFPSGCGTCGHPGGPGACGMN